MFSLLLASFGTGTYTVTRTAVGSYSGGDYVPGSTTVLNMDGALQPLSHRDIEVLPEGLHVANTKKIFTSAPLRVLPADVVTVSGEQWTVVSTVTNEECAVLPGFGHYEAILARSVTP